MDRGAGLMRLEMRRRSGVMAGWCWVSAAAAAVAVGSEAGISAVWGCEVFGLSVYDGMVVDGGGHESFDGFTVG